MAQPRGMRRAIVAVARRLAVVLHRMWVDGTEFNWSSKEAAAHAPQLRKQVLPVLMGLLGSMTYVLRRYLRSVGDRLLTPRDLREYIVRLVLGTVFGVAIGFFTSANGNAAEQVIVNSASSLGAPALAFLAGYGVETVFRMLDGLAEQFSSARK